MFNPYDRIAGVPNVSAFRPRQVISLLGDIFHVMASPGQIVNPRLSPDNLPRNPFGENQPVLYRPVNTR